MARTVDIPRTLPVLQPATISDVVGELEVSIDETSSQVITGTKTFQNGLVLGDESGVGVKLGEGSTATYGWKDITSSIEVRGVASTDPNWTQVGSSGLYAYAFAVNDVIWMTYHIPHDIVPSTDVYFHVH